MPEKATHPSPEALSAYGLGQLPPAEAAVVESHISECQPCCETMLGLSSDDTFVALLQEAKQLPTDQTLDQDGVAAEPSSSVQDVPALLAEHPRYEIFGLIGKGGMGDVYRARHRMMDRTVALKIINCELVRKPEAVDRFHREVKTAAQLSHPNVVAAFDAEQAGDVHFLVMEYVDGTDLSHLVRDRGALSIADACEYVRQAATGLQHAHEQGMVHRDIKPHNLMVTAEGTVKILDFGLASLAPAAMPDAEPVEARGDLTAVGSIMGTPDFISPEQADDARQADIRSDIYSLGATLYFLLSGRPPFADGSVLHKLKSHAQLAPDSLKSLRDDIPDDLADVVSRMMAKDPDQRFQSAAEVAEALESFSRATQTAQDRSPQHQIQPRPKRRRVLPLTAVATLSVAAIVAAFVYIPSPGTGPFMVGGGGFVANEGWSFSSGSIYLQRNEPGVLFGIRQDPNGRNEFSYVVLFRHSANDTSKVTRPKGARVRFDGEVASITDGINIDGKGLEFNLKLRLDRSKRTIESIRMTIDGEAIDYSQGRLLLVDLTADSPSFTQVTAKLPNDLPNLRDIVEDTEVVSRLARQLQQLDGVREFLASAPLAAAGRSTHQNHDVASDHEQIQGTWHVTYSEDSGRIAPQEMLKDLRFIFSKDTLTTEVNGRKSKTTYRLGPSTTPKAIDLTEGDTTTLGIYDLQGDTLRICLTEGRQGERPTAFDSQPDSANDVLIMLKRGQPADNQGSANHDIKGTWRGVSYEDGGRSLEHWRNIKLTIELGVNRAIFTWYLGEKGDQEAINIYKLDPGRNPGWIDEDDENGSKGIYELKGGMLTICRAVERPTTFEAKPDSTRIVLKRDTQELSPADAKALIPEAASIANDDFEKLVKTPNPAAIESQSLSLVLMTLHPSKQAQQNPAVANDFRYLTGNIPEPSTIAEAMWISRGKGYASFMQPEYISECETTSTNGIATGTVFFNADKLYAGAVEFTARRSDGSWRIEEFRLPNYGIRTVRGDDGKWKQAPLAGKQLSDRDRAAAQIKQLDAALEIYKLDNGTYPSTEEGLKALIQRPADGNNAESWGGPYLKELPTDPWGREIAYEFPGTRGGDGTKPEIRSWGPDGIDSTNDDIGNEEASDSAPIDQIAVLLDAWKRLPEQSEGSEAAAKISTLHNELSRRQAPNTENSRQTLARLALLSWPFLSDSIPKTMAQTLADLTKPDAAIRMSDRLAEADRPTEPVGWDVQAVHALALARAGRTEEALRENEALMKKIDVNLRKGRLPEMQLEFLGTTRSQKSLLKQTMLQKSLILSIAGKTAESVDASTAAGGIEVNNSTQDDPSAIQEMLRMIVATAEARESDSSGPDNVAGPWHPEAESDESPAREILDQTYRIFDVGNPIGKRHLVATEKAQTLSIDEETLLTLGLPAAVGIVERDTSVDYSLSGDGPQTLRGEFSVKEAGAPVTTGTFEFADGQAVMAWTSYSERGHTLETPKKQNATVKPPAGPIVFESTILVIGPRLLPDDGQRKIVWAEIDNTPKETLVEFQTGYRLERTRRAEGAGFTITLFKPDSSKPEMALDFDAEGECERIRAGSTIVMQPQLMPLPKGQKERALLRVETEKPFQEIESAFEQYFKEKHPLYAELSDRPGLEELVRSKAERRKLAEEAEACPVAKMINSFPGKPLLTFIEKSELSKDKISLIEVDLYRNEDGTCRVVVREQHREKQDGVAFAKSKPITEEDIRRIIKHAAAGTGNTQPSAESQDSAKRS